MEFTVLNNDVKCPVVGIGTFMLAPADAQNSVREALKMRVCHMWEGAGKIRFGIYACSPEDSSFTAAFTNMKITECAWKAHDGQKPDEE